MRQRVFLVHSLRGRVALLVRARRTAEAFFMSCSFFTTIRRLAVAFAAVAAIGITSTEATAQFFRQPSVGGVKIDTDGVVSNPQVGELKQLQAAWKKGLEQVPADLQKWTDLRFVSLKQ